VFWGDERHVPFNDSRSNYGNALNVLLSKVPIPTNQIHPFGEASQYETQLRKYFGSGDASFDLVLLGLGKDGHTASLFPGSSALKEKLHWAVQVQNANEEFARVTLTPPILNLAKKVLFLVDEKEKKEILGEVLCTVSLSHHFPAQLIHPVSHPPYWLIAQEPQ